jgi:hypothetical protein
LGAALFLHRESRVDSERRAEVAMKRWWTVAVPLVAVVLLAGVAVAHMGWGPMGPGMGWGHMGPGMMGPGMMGMGPGMMGGWYQGQAAGQALTLEQAEQRVQAYLEQVRNQDLVLDEVMAFQYNFYALVKEKSTGRGAFELLVDRMTGAVFPEHGPNMMWNTKYGMMAHMGGMMGYQPPTGPMTVSADQAKSIAQQWLDRNLPGTTTEAPDAFYGYYTVHTRKDGKISGMLSVNGYGGAVWYHAWHGAFIASKEAMG